MKGNIHTFNPEKGYGFIIGENSNRYFFHVSEWLHDHNPMEKNRVSFTPIRSEKGLRAHQVKSVFNKDNTKPKTFFDIYDKFLFLHDAEPENLAVYFTSDEIFVTGNKSYNTLRAELKEQALKLGANSILSLKEEKMYKNSGNTTYTYNKVSGRFAIIGKYNGLKDTNETLSLRVQQIKNYTFNFHETLRKRATRNLIISSTIALSCFGFLFYLYIS